MLPVAVLRNSGWMDKVKVGILDFLGLFPCFSGMPATFQPVFALPNGALSSWGEFIQKHRTKPNAKTSLISCVGAKPN